MLIDFPLQTAVAALHVFLGMSKPGAGGVEGKVLIWGAGGAVGSYAVQYAKSVSVFNDLISNSSPKGVLTLTRLGIQ